MAEQRKKTKFDNAADQELFTLVCSRHILIYAVSWEEQQVIDALVRICDTPEANLSGVQVWDAASGLTTAEGEPIEAGEAVSTPEQVLDHISRKGDEMRNKKKESKANRGPIFVLCDVFRYLQNHELVPELERRIRALSWQLRDTSICVVMISPTLELPTALQKCVTVVDYPLPGPTALRNLVEEARASLVATGKIEEKSCAPTENVVRALQGLTTQEAEDALAKSAVTKQSLDIGTLNDLKRQVIRKGQLLDFVQDLEGMDELGGFDGVKQWVAMRKKSFTEKAKQYGLPEPKGIFLLGVQGSGKSLCAKAVASELGVPLLQLSMGRMFGQYVGESEGRMREALSLAESVAPCVLLIDEVDKGLSGSSGESGDQGTTKRVISGLLNWLQEKKSPVFVVACANSLSGIPPEFLRRGRFDERFFVELPSEDERRDIFAIHLRKPPRGRDPGKFDVNKLAQQTDGFSGAEIEGVILDAMHVAFSQEEREFDTKDILAAIKTCIPLSKVMKEALDALREGARKRTRLANAPLFEPADPGQAGDRFKNLGI